MKEIHKLVSTSNHVSGLLLLKLNVSNKKSRRVGIIMYPNPNLSKRFNAYEK